MAIERATPGTDSAAYDRYGQGGLGEDPSKGPMMIGGTHRVSTKLDPNTCLNGGYQGIEGDTMPAGAPAVGTGSLPPYTPDN